MRISETSGALALGSPLPTRTASSSAVLSATSHISRSRIWPANMGSPLLARQWLLPTHSPERATGSGKRIDALDALSTPLT